LNIYMPSLLRKFLVFTSLAALVGCADGVYDEIELMPSPSVYESAGFDPFPDVDEASLKEQSRLFYVTDRAPATPQDEELRYTKERGQVLRAGIADIKVTPSIDDWEEVRQITLRGERDQDYRLEVADTQEIGVLPVGATEFLASPPTGAEMDAAGRAFAAKINRQLSLSQNKDIFIYIHGYNVDFEYPVLVSKELQHYLGYQGVFISYNWPATPNRLAYFKDIETASATRRNLRVLLEYLSDNTNARRIHLIGYSAGSRLAFEVTYQIALQNKGKSGPRLGNVLLVSSDLDRGYFGQALADGLLDVVDRMTLYLSGTDAALGMSNFVYGRQRLGQIWAEEDVWPALEVELARLNKLEMIDATDADRASAGNGHWYFRSSPWASSDILVSLLTGFSAAERGLVRSDGRALWTFPADYVQRLSGLRAN